VVVHDGRHLEWHSFFGRLSKRRPPRAFAGRLAQLALTFTVAAACQAQSLTACGDLRNGVGPFDYRTATKAQIELVEQYHFDPGVESLTRGMTGSLGDDIDYTLRAFPNHSRALLSMANLGLREKTARPRGARYTVDCYFDRATRFRPDDGIVPAIHGYYLLKKGDPKLAVREFEKALQLRGADANVHYNLGLAYFDLGDYEKSFAQAKLAYSLGHPLPGLREKLRRQGNWQD
jgi:tetratricopeptide (TPR) repeat protein